MPAVARLSDIDSDDNVIVSTGNNTNVFANGLLIARIGDVLSDGATIVTGSATVFVNGLPVARIGDLDTDGAVIVTGSPTVSCG